LLAFARQRHNAYFGRALSCVRSVSVARASNLLLIVIGLAVIVALLLFGTVLHSGYQDLGGLIYVIDGIAIAIVIALLVWLVVRKW
jgi:hypothetical protein